jgi:hypothetical protein
MIIQENLFTVIELNFPKCLSFKNYFSKILFFFGTQKKKKKNHLMGGQLPKDLLEKYLIPIRIVILLILEK